MLQDWLPTIIAILGVAFTAWRTLAVVETRTRDIQKEQDAMWKRIERDRKESVDANRRVHERIDAQRDKCPEHFVGMQLFNAVMEEIRRRLKSIEGKVDRRNGIKKTGG